MAVNADTLLDRLYLKNQIGRWRALAILFGVIALVVAGQRYASNPIKQDYVARVTFDGIIRDDQKLYDMVDDLAKDDRAKAVVLWLDTPGGSAVGGEELFVRLRKLSQKKPVVAVMRSIAASAGYMIALGADHVVAREGTITGSIGVLIETADVTGLAEKIGVKPVIVKSSPLKGTPSLFEKTTPEAEAAVQDVIDDFYQRFVDMVAQRRELPRARVLKLADGRIYSGKAALENKLIDAVGGEEEAMAWLQEARQLPKGLEIHDIEPKKDHSLLEQLTQSVAGHFFQTGRAGLDGLSAIWHPRYH